jgi:hypothetical protein
MITSSSNRRDLLIIAIALAGVLLYAVVAMSSGGIGFPLDDSWIHQTYGRNLAQTGQWEYVPGIPSAGSTSPLYTVLLTVGYWLHIPFFVWAYGLGALALAGTGLIGARLAKRLFPSVPNVELWTGLAIVGAWHQVWAASSGMETIIFTLFCLLLIHIAWSEIDKPPDQRREFIRGIAFGITGALLISTRPEGILLIAILGTLMLIARPQSDWKMFVVWAVGAALGGFVGIMPYAMLNYSLNQTVLPNTAAAKQAENLWLLQRPFLTNLWAMITPLTAGGQLLLLPGAIVTLNELRRTLRKNRADVLYLAPLLWAFGLILLYTIRLPAYYQHGRYVIPAVAPLIVFSVGGVLSLLQRRSSFVQRVVLRTLTMTTLTLFVVFWGYGALIFSNDVQLINSEMVVSAKWLADNIPADQLLAIHDIGAVGYYAPRPMLDLAGLISPEIIPIINDNPAKMSFMQDQGAKYLIVLPEFLPTTPDDPRLCLQFDANGKMGGMVVYKLAWDEHCN